MKGGAPNHQASVDRPNGADAGATLPAVDGSLRHEALWHAKLAAWIGAVWLLSSLLAPPLYELVAPLFDEPIRFARVARRVAMLVAIVFLWLWVRREGGLRRETFGFPRARGGQRRFLTALALGWTIGALVLAIEVSAGTWTIGIRITADDLVEATLGALIIGFLEEGVFRGFLLLARPPLGRVALAFRVTTVTFVYSAVHFARGGAAGGAVDMGEGFAVWARVPAAIATQFEAFVGLAALGLLFAVLALRDGDAFRAAGLHAGIVGGVGFAALLFDPRVPGASILLANGIQPGWIGSGALALASLALWLGRQQR